MTLWIEDGALEDWQTRGPGGQARYTDAAIQTSLILRAAFKLPLRQTEGLLASVLTLMDLTITAPDHTTVSRRAVTLPVIPATSAPHGPLHVLIDSTGLQVYGAGQWQEAKHGAKSRRKWHKLHLAVDAASGMIVAQTLTDQDAGDPSQVAPARPCCVEAVLVSGGWAAAHMGKPIRLPGTLSRAVQIPMPNIATTFPSRGIGSRTGRSMTLR